MRYFRIGLVFLLAMATSRVFAATAPVGYWKFDEAPGATIAADSSGRGHDGTISGATVTGGVRGNCLDFDGFDDDVTIAHHSDFDFASFTFSAWIYPSEDFPNPNSHRCHIVSKGRAEIGDGAFSAFYEREGGALFYYIRDASNTDDELISAPLDRNHWFHFVISYDNSSKEMAVYHDGSLYVSITAALSAMNTNTLDLVIGGFAAKEFHWLGKIDEVKIWDRALSPTEIRAEFDEVGPQPPEIDECYGSFETMGVNVRLSSAADPERDAVATPYYREDSDSTWIEGFPLSRIRDWWFCGSLFWLEDGTTYDVRVDFSDATPPAVGSLHGVTVYSSGTTRAETSVAAPTPNNTYYVAPGGSDSTGTGAEGSPWQTVGYAVTRMSGGDRLYLRDGTYYEGEIEITTGGLQILGFPGETAILDGAYSSSTITWYDYGESGIWYTYAAPECNMVLVDGQRCFFYEFIEHLAFLGNTHSGEFHGLNGQFAASGATTVAVHLVGDVDPNTRQMVVTRYHDAFSCRDGDDLFFENLSFRHYGRFQSPRSGHWMAERGSAIDFLDCDSAVVRGCSTTHCAYGFFIQGTSERCLVDNCQFTDTVGGWTLQQMKDGARMENGGVAIYSIGRGNVVRNCRVQGLGDGLRATPFSRSAVNAQGLSSETDFYDNVVVDCIDDCIESDGWQANVRFFRNRLMIGTLRAISTSPVYFGPVYMLRNEAYFLDGAAWKWLLSSDQFQPGHWYAFHNTLITTGGALVLHYNTTFPHAELRSANNIYYSRDEVYGITSGTTHKLDFDYDNFYSETGSPFFGAWVDGGPTERHNSLAELWAATNPTFNPNGVSENPRFVDLQTGNLALSDSSLMIDAGKVIPGINNAGSAAFQGAGPDIGASESPYLTLRVQSDPSTGGTVLRNPDRHGLAVNESVTLTPQPAPGYQFDRWSGDLSGSANPANVIMDTAKNITAHFVLTPYSVTVTIDPPGGGSVSTYPEKPEYFYGDIVILSATPTDASWSFRNWSGDLTGTNSPAGIVVVDSDVNITAHFSQQHTLTILLNPSEGGSVSKDPSKSAYDPGETVTLTASPNSGWQFTGWSGAVSGSDTSVQLTMDGDKVVTADFARLPGPNLAGSLTGVSPVPVVLTRNVVFEGNVVNNGDQAVAGSIWVEFWVVDGFTGFLCDSIEIQGGLAAGASVDLSTMPRRSVYETVPSGLFSIEMRIDRVNAVPESNEGDNVSRLGPIEFVADLPDLAVEDFSISPYDFSPTGGTTIAFTGKVRNNGSRSTDQGAWIEFRISNTLPVRPSDPFLCDSAEVAAGLRQGREYDLSSLVRSTYPVPAGFYYVGVFVDVTNAVTERSEENNYLWMSQRLHIGVTPASRWTLYR